MTLNMRTAVLAGLLAMTGILATTDRADAQVYQSNTGPYYYYVPPSAAYSTYAPPGTSFSYYTPTSGATSSEVFSSYYPARSTAWDGGWAVPNYTSPAYSAYANYRATRGGFRR